MDKPIIQISMRRLAEIAEKSPGYSVLVVQMGQASQMLAEPVECSNIRFLRRGGRRCKGVVQAEYLGHTGLFDSYVVASILD